MTEPEPQAHPTSLISQHGQLTGVTVYFTPEQVAAGWAGDPEELRLSVTAAVNEVIGDDGVPYRPVGTSLVHPPEPEGLPLHLQQRYATALAAEQSDDTLPAE